MLTKTEAIVLHSLKYGETKLIVDLFTRRHGRLAFAVALPKTPRGRLKKQYFQPLTLLSIECDVRPQLQLQKLADAAVLMPMATLLTDPSKLAIALFLAEFLYHALKGEQQNEPLFDYVRSSIEWLDGKADSYANFHLVFLMHLSRFLGFYPNLEQEGRWQEEGSRKGSRADEAALYFDLRAATFCAAPPLHRDYLLPQEAEILRLMMRMDWHNMHLFRMSHQQRNRCLDVALQFYRIHLPDFPDLRSVEVLRELWV